MYDLEYFRRLFTYDDWANRGVVDAMRKAPEKARKALGHIIGAHAIWLSRLNGTPARVPVWPDLNVGDCARELDAVRAEWNAFFDRSPSLDDVVTYTNSKGETFTSSVADILTHVVIHGAYHRGQIASATREAGGEPAYTDFIHAARTGAV